MNWQPIQNLPSDWRTLQSKSENLQYLAEIWREEKSKLANQGVLDNFLVRLKRKVSIETGIIERLYSIDRGVTQLLIEKGIDHSLIPHGTTDKAPSEIVTVIRDHERATDLIFDVVANQRNISTSFIKQLHQLLTRNQFTVEAMDQFGRLGEVELIQGDWKKLPNNPQRSDGTIHQYCPPEHVASQMDQLITWHLAHEEVSPEVEAAWLHHRFTQIHPFQDGNGRVARLLATSVFIKAGWFPFVLNVQSIHDQARNHYLDALEKADGGDLIPLVKLMADAQRQSFLEVLGLAQNTVAERGNRQEMLRTVGDKLRNTYTHKRNTNLLERVAQAHQRADAIFQLALEEFRTMRDSIQEELSAVQGQVQMNHALNTDERASYYRYQIIETAKRQEYYANLNGYRAWILLSIRIDNLHQTEWLFSLHELGREQVGVMVCSMCAYRRYPDEPNDARELEPLSNNPFEFTYHEPVDKLNGRFKEWLDELLNLGIIYWNKGL